MVKLNRIDKRYGKLRVISEVGKNKHRRLLFRCLCDCGSEIVISGDQLSSGKTKSCGCLRYETVPTNKIGDRSYAIHKKHYGFLVKRHTKIDINEPISFDRFLELSNGRCHYCSSDDKKILSDRIKNSDVSVECMGIDRMNSGIGYTSDNSVSCCTGCNNSKMDLSYEQFKSHIEKIFIYRKDMFSASI